MNILGSIKNIFWHKGHDTPPQQATTKPAQASSISEETSSIEDPWAVKQQWRHLYYVSESDSRNLEIYSYAVAPTLKASGELYWQSATDKPFSCGVPSQMMVNGQDGIADGQLIDEANPPTIEIVTNEGKKIKLSYLTNELYKENIQRYTTNKTAYETTAKLQEYYLKNFGPIEEKPK
jgi:hypothetical protein